jgi:hypothetical protein
MVEDETPSPKRRRLTRFSNATGARLALTIGLIAVVAALFMPVIVAWDDASARERHEESMRSEPVKILGFTVGRGDFEPPSEKGIMGGRALLLMFGVASAGLAALIVGMESAIFGPERLLALLGAASGPGAAVLAAVLSPMGLGALALVGVVFLLVAVAVSFTVGTGGGW